MYQRLDISKVNWSKMNSNLEISRLKSTELSIIDNLFNTIFDHHTNLNTLIFIRKYFLSVMIRTHSFFKDTNMLRSNKEIKDLYDYLLTSTILSTEISAGYGLDSGINWFITRIVTRMFDVDSVNTAYVVIDGSYPFRHKFIIEPIISSGEKMTAEKAKDFINFLFNLFSYCEGANKYVSISVICSSLWLKGFKELPYLVDDTIVPDFSSGAEFVRVVNSILLSRHKFIVEGLSSNSKENNDFGDLTLEEFESNEPEEIYSSLKEVMAASGSTEDSDLLEEEIEEDDEDEIVTELFPDLISEEYEDGERLPSAIEREISLYNSYLTDLNTELNGIIVQSDLDLDEVKGKPADLAYKRLKTMYRIGRSEDSDVTDIMEGLRKLEREYRRSNKRKKKTSKKIDQVSKTIQEIKEAHRQFIEEEKKTNKEIEAYKFEGFKNSIQQSEIFASFSELSSFSDYVNDVLSTISKTGSSISTDTIGKIISGYNATRENKIVFKNIQNTEDGKIHLDRFFGSKLTDKCTIENGVFKSVPFSVKSPKGRKEKTTKCLPSKTSEKKKKSK